MVNIQLRSIADTHYALIERYDRHLLGSGQMARLDIRKISVRRWVSATNAKYQEDGGPSFADRYRLVQDVSSDPANDLQYLLRWQISMSWRVTQMVMPKPFAAIPGQWRNTASPFMISFALGPLNVLTIIWHFPLAMKNPIQASFPQSTGMTWRNNAVCVLGFYKARCRMLLSVCWSTCSRREKV